MRSKIFLILEASLLAFGMFTLQSCFEPNPYYGPNYGPGYAPGYALPPVYGDYDENRHWHDRDWWVSNRHDWAQQHHPDWITPGRREMQPLRDQDQRHVSGRDDQHHDRDGHGHEQGPGDKDQH
ncbi:MAG: hypothetical protein ABSC63_02225 [Candidatus Binataceae bacterium]|jgi:hypothetical protein